MGRSLKAQVLVTPGLEAVCATELRSLGARDVTPMAGVVVFHADPRALQACAVGVRTATRLLGVVAKGSARSFAQLDRMVREAPWADYLPPDVPVSLHVSCRHSRLYHQGAVADRVAAAMGRQVSPGGVGVWVRVNNDRASLCVDGSGDRLHQRGYRIDTGPAPLRETLAAGVLLLGGYDGTEPLLDPMCGSGTFPIEGALIASGLAPGRNRDHAMARWPCMANDWRAPANVHRPVDCSHIVGSDASTVAVADAARNAQRAGVSVAFSMANAANAVAPHGPPGLVVANPPYGARLQGLASAFSELEALLGRLNGWRSLVLYPADARQPQGWESLATLNNGGIRVRVLSSSPTILRSGY